jgi:F0F1-type ATP synthase alpha subunit
VRKVLESSSDGISISDLSLSKPPLKRNLVSQQLFTGHLRLDMANPMSQGNFIVLKGDKRASGKELVVQGAINSFLGESPDNRVVYVGLN